jgi:hypothetical protein
LEVLGCPKMNFSAFDELFSYLAEKSEPWEPNGIVLTTSIGDLNLLDYIKGGIAGDEGFILFNDAPLFIACPIQVYLRFCRFIN